MLPWRCLTRAARRSKTATPKRGLRVQLAVLCTLCCTLWACSTSKPASFPEDDYLTFAPDDHFALVLRRDGQKSALGRFDLTRREPVWEVPLASSVSGLSFARDGGHFATVTPIPGTPSYQVAVRRSADGNQIAVLQQTTSGNPPQVLNVEASERVALSNDARWLAIAEPEALHVYALPSGKRILLEREPQHRPIRVRFDPTGTQLALAQRAPDQPAYREVVVFASGGNGWHPVATLGGAAEPEFTSGGLLVLREASIERWHDGTHQPLIEFPKGLVPLQFADDRGPSAHYAPNGRLAVIEMQDRFVIADLVAGRLVYERYASVLSAAVSNQTATVFLSEELEGRLLRFDAGAPAPREEESFGVLGRYTRRAFNFSERSSWEPEYSARVSEAGRYLVITRDGVSHLHPLP